MKPALEQTIVHNPDGYSRPALECAVSAAPLLAALSTLPLIFFRRTRAVPFAVGALALWQSRHALKPKALQGSTYGRSSSIAPHEPFRIMSSNVLFKNHSPRLAAETIMATNPDVIVLVEVSLAVALHVDKQRYPYELVFSRIDDRGLGYDLRVLSRHPLEHYDDAAAGGRFFPLIRVSLHDSNLTLTPVHTAAPHRVCDKPYWRAELAGLGESLRYVQGPLVVCGDFNASLSHRPMARFIKSARLSSVLARHGRALRGTWGPRGIVALLPIDHVLVSQDVSSLAIDVVRVPGSDHRALVADIAVPRTSAE